MGVLTLPRGLDNAAQHRAIEKRRCEISLAEFVKAGWHIIEPSQPYLHNWHIDFICVHLEAIADGVQFEDDTYYNRLLINIPPGTMKSLLVGVFFPAWVWGPYGHPERRFLSVTHSQDLTERDTNNTRVLILSDWYQGHWGDKVKITRSKFDMLENSRRGFRQSATWSNVTGKRAHHVLIDDPHSVKTAESDAERTTTVRLFREAIPSRLVDPIRSSITVVMQRLHEADVSGTILEGVMGYDHIRLPMRYDPERAKETMLGYQDPRTEEGELLFPLRFPQHVVDRDEAALGPYATAGQLQQNPEPRGGGIIKDSWWKLWDRSEYSPVSTVVASLDTAYTIKTENDPSAMSVFGVFDGALNEDNITRLTDRYGNMIKDEAPIYRSDDIHEVSKTVMMYAWTERLELHDLVKKVVDTCRMMKVDYLLIENKAAGHSVAQELRRLFANEDFAVIMYDPKTADKTARLYSVQHLFSEGMVYAPAKSWAETVIRQTSVFPRGKHDDLVDTVSMCLQYIRNMGMLIRAPERLAQIDRDKTHIGGGLAPLYGGN